MEEIKKVALACGLPGFRYYAFPPAIFMVRDYSSDGVTPDTAATGDLEVSSPIVDPAMVSSLEPSDADAVAGREGSHPEAGAFSEATPKPAAFRLLSDISKLVEDPPPTGAFKLAQRGTFNSRDLREMPQAMRRRTRPAARVALAVVDRQN